MEIHQYEQPKKFSQFLIMHFMHYIVLCTK